MGSDLVCRSADLQVGILNAVRAEARRYKIKMSHYREMEPASSAHITTGAMCVPPGVVCDDEGST